MAEYTTNLNLKKPSLSDVADITDINGNMDILDCIAPKDEGIGAQPWTSKQIVDTLCPPISETGNPVQCYPVKGYPLSVTASWEPTQEGSGDPSPDNIRPITGRDSVTITHNGTVHTLTLPKTIYGGSVGSDGKGTNKWEKATVTECKGIDRTGTDVLIVTVKHNLTTINNEGLCDKAINSGDLWKFKPHTWRVGMDGANLFLTVPLSVLSEATVTGVTAYLTANPYTFVFPLNGTFTATGGTELTAVDGVNTVSTDADSVTVKGAEDPKHTIAELKNAISTANETTTTAEEVAEGE